MSARLASKGERQRLFVEGRRKAGTVTYMQNQEFIAFDGVIDRIRKSYQGRDAYSGNIA